VAAIPPTLVNLKGKTEYSRDRFGGSILIGKDDKMQQELIGTA